MTISGRVWKFGDDVNTDVIFPGKYTYTITDADEMAKHALEDLEPTFVAQVQENDIIVGGKNFGCGSSREQAVTCLKYNHVGAVVAKSFSRLYFRNGINVGLATVQCPQAVDLIQNKEKMTIDFEKGLLYCKAGEFEFSPLPEFVQDIIRAGGLIPYTKKRIAENK